MKTSFTLIGFVAVALAIGALEAIKPVEDDPNRIVISKAQRDFVQSQVQSQGPGPGQTGFDEAMNTFIEEEILYREGRKLGLDQDDLIVKRRVVQKMRFMLEDMTPVAPPTEAQLQEWLSKHPERYKAGQSVRIEHHFFSRAKRGDDALAAAQSLRESALQGNSGLQGDPFPLSENTDLVDEARLVRELGSVAAARVMDLPVNEWSQPIGSSLGVHVVRVLEKTGGRPQTLSEVRQRVEADLVAAQREAVNAAAIKALRSKYTVAEGSAE